MNIKDIKDITIRNMPEGMWKQIKVQAMLEGITIAEIIIKMATLYLKETK